MSHKLSRRDVVKAAAGIAGATIAPTAILAQSVPEQTRQSVGSTKPNIIVFIADDAGAGHFGIYGSSAAVTPNIDALGRTGLVADQAILTTPQCSPSRISILSGMHPHATGAEDLHSPLPAGIDLLPHYLKQAGYYTGAMKKMHLGPEGEAQFDWYRDNLTSIEEFLDASGESPFFMWVGFSDPHRPYRPSKTPSVTKRSDIVIPQWMIDSENTREELGLYYDEIARMDRDVGAMMEAIRRRGLGENTLAIVISDNGAPFPREKGTLYDTGIRTPFIANWPGRISAGMRHNKLISVIDMAPSLMSLAGLATPLHFHGRDMSAGLIDPEKLTRQYSFSQRNWHNADEHMRSIRSPRFKLIRNSYLDQQHGTAADIGGGAAFKDLLKAKESGELTPQQQQIFAKPRPQYEFFDLRRDPNELVNRYGADEYRDTIIEMTARLDQWRLDTHDHPESVRRRPDNVSRETAEKPAGAAKLPPFLDDDSN